MNLIHPEGARRVFPACSGPCNQGKSICPCPDACQVTLPDPDRPGLPARVLVAAIAAVLVLLFAAPFFTN